MLKIGEFSKIAHVTIKTLRYYEEEKLLMAISKDDYNGYRYYDTNQLETLSLIKSYQQLGFSIDKIKRIIDSTDKKEMLNLKLRELEKEKTNIDIHLSNIKICWRGK